MLQQETLSPIHCEILGAYTGLEVKLDSLLVACNHPGNLTVNYYAVHSS